MTTREITRISALAATLYVVHFLGSWVLYLELVNFVILLYGVYLPRKQAWYSVFIFTLLVVLTRGLSMWSFMYILVFPQYALLYSFIKDKIDSEYALGAIGFLLAFLCGTLIDLPFILMSGAYGKALVIRLLMGFQVSLGNGLCTFLATIYFSKRMGKILSRT